MSDKHSGFDWGVKKPKRDDKVARFVIWPLLRGREGADKEAKLERDLGRSSAIRLATKLLRACNAPTELVEQVIALDEMGRAAEI